MGQKTKKFFRRLNLKKSICFLNGIAYLFITVNWLLDDRRVGLVALVFTAIVSVISFALGIVQILIEKRDRQENNHQN